MKPTRRALMTAGAAAGVLGSAHARPAKQALITLQHSAFPYEGSVPDTGQPFLDTTQDGQPGHLSPRGGFYAADTTYHDKRSLLHVGAGFRGNPRALVVVFFHGNQATLTRDVINRQRVTAQFDASRINGVLVAPQLAVDALDSSAGNFWEAGYLGRYLDEASGHLAKLSETPAQGFRDARVILVAYSGGYLPLAYSLEDAALKKRLAGVILLDGLYGETQRFEQWIVTRHRRSFFVSAWGRSSLDENVLLNSNLSRRGVPIQTQPPQSLNGGGVWSVPALSAEHGDFLTRAWVEEPLRELLSKVR